MASVPEVSHIECPDIEFLPVSANAFGPQRPIGIYIQVHSASEPYELSLDPLVAFTGEAPWATIEGTNPIDTLDAVEELQMQTFYTYTPGYRVGETCGRLAVHNDYQVRDVEAFVAPDGPGRLALFDSLGRHMLTLGGTETGGPKRSASGTSRQSAGSSGTVAFDPSGPRLRTAVGQLDLAQVVPYGRWYVRPPGVKVGQADLVLVHTCDLSNPSDSPCGADMDDDGVPLADPYFPYVTHLGVRALEGGATLEITPYAVGWQETSFAGANPAGQRVGQPLTFKVSPR